MPVLGRYSAKERFSVAETQWRPYFNTPVFLLKNPQAQRPLLEIIEDAANISRLLGFGEDDDIVNAFRRALQLLEAHHGWQSIIYPRRAVVNALLALRYTLGQYQYLQGEHGLVSRFIPPNVDLSYISGQFGIEYVDIFFVMLTESVGLRLGLLDKIVLTANMSQPFLQVKATNQVTLFDCVVAGLAIAHLTARHWLPEDAKVLVQTSIAMRLSKTLHEGLTLLQNSATLESFLADLRSLRVDEQLYYSWRYIDVYLNFRETVRSELPSPFYEARITNTQAQESVASGDRAATKDEQAHRHARDTLTAPHASLPYQNPTRHDAYAAQPSATWNLLNDPISSDNDSQHVQISDEAMHSAMTSGQAPDSSPVPEAFEISEAPDLFDSWRPHHAKPKDK